MGNKIILGKVQNFMAKNCMRIEFKFYDTEKNVSPAFNNYIAESLRNSGLQKHSTHLVSQSKELTLKNVD